MAKLSAWSTTPADNNATPPLGWPEGMAPSAVNNTARQDRASLREWYEDAQWLDYGIAILDTTGQVVKYTGDVSAWYTVGRKVRLNGTNLVMVASVAFDGPDLEVTFVGTVPGAVTTSELHVITIGAINFGDLSAGGLATGGDVLLYTNSITRLTIQSTGEVEVADDLSVGVDLSVAGQALFGDGSDALPGISATADPDTGIRFRGSNVIAFVTVATERARFNSTGQLALVTNADATPELTGTTDVNTGIRFPGSEVIAFCANGAEVARFDSSPRLLIGTASAIQVDSVTNAAIQVAATDAGGRASLVLVRGSVTAATAPTVKFARSKGASGGTVVANGDALGSVDWNPHDGTNYADEAAKVSALVDGAFATTPGARLAFSTRAADSALAERLVLMGDGRLYGTALHDNAGAVTGTTEQYIASGTWTPTLTNTTNLSASTANQGQWIRVGNVVVASVMINIDPTIAGAIVLGVSLPIASAFGSAQRLSGTAASNTATEVYAVFGDAPNDRATVGGLAVDVAAHNIMVHFTYVVL